MNNSFSVAHPELVCERSERNLPLTPDRITYGSNKIAWWKADCGHEWNTLISTRSGGSKCPYCSGIILLKGFNDFATMHPSLAEEWSERNLPLTPDMVNEKSRRNVWWKCSIGHSWKAKIYERTIERKGCRVCEKELCGVNYRAAIQKRNRWLVDRADCLIAYLFRNFGDAYETIKYAKKQGNCMLLLMELMPHAYSLYFLHIICNNNMQKGSPMILTFCI